jgi:hypothetical protein
MPSVNIYTSGERVQSLENILSDLREFTAEKLSCKDRKLSPNEISLRVIVPETGLTVADTELEIKAYSYPERIKKQDKICLSIRKYMQKYCPQAGSVCVWLQLSELGYSAQE